MPTHQVERVHLACPSCGAEGSYVEATERCLACDTPYESTRAIWPPDHQALAVQRRIATAVEAIAAELVRAREAREYREGRG